MSSPKEIFCLRCAQKVISTVVSCKCGDLDQVFCSKYCYERNMKTHRNECQGKGKTKVCIDCT